MKVTMVRVLIELKQGRLKEEYIRFKDDPLSVIKNKTREHLDKKYTDYNVLGIYIFEMVAELKSL